MENRCWEPAREVHHDMPFSAPLSQKKRTWERNDVGFGVLPFCKESWGEHMCIYLCVSPKRRSPRKLRGALRTHSFHYLRVVLTVAKILRSLVYTTKGVGTTQGGRREFTISEFGFRVAARCSLLLTAHGYPALLLGGCRKLRMNVRIQTSGSDLTGASHKRWTFTKPLLHQIFEERDAPPMDVVVRVLVEM